jgi:hypothetical protein
MSDRFEAIGRLEEELTEGFEGLTPHWEVRGVDPVLTVRGDELQVQLVAQDDGRFRLTTEVSAEQVAQLLTVLTRRSAAPAYRTRSRRLVAVS